MKPEETSLTTRNDPNNITNKNQPAVTTVQNSVPLPKKIEDDLDF